MSMKTKEKYRFPERPPVSRNTQKSVDALREFYALGKRAYAETASAPYGTAAMPRFAVGKGTSSSLAYDARKIVKLYSRREFNKLIEKCEEQDFPLGPSHLVELIRVPYVKERAILLWATFKNRWSVRRLNQEIADLKKKLRKGKHGSSGTSTPSVAC